MDKIYGKVVKWLYKDNRFRIFINDAMDIVVKEYRTIPGGRKPKWIMVAAIKRHASFADKLGYWIPPYLNENTDRWVSFVFNDATHIRNEKEIPLTDKHMEIYNGVILARRLSE